MRLVACVLAFVIASAAWMRHRDAAYEASALAEARAGLARAPVVEPARGSEKYPFLRKRRLAGRVLGLGVDDKLYADAAAAVERDGAFARVLADGRVLAAAPAPGGTAVALVCPSTRREAYPLWLPLSFLVAAALLVRFGGMRVDLRALRRHRVAYTYLAPAALGMGLLVLAPFVTGLVIGFFDHTRGEWHYVGLANFAAILSGAEFWFTLAVTLAWTSVNVALHVTIGLALALALRERWLRARGLLRVLLILPWAIPNYITALIWRGMFQTQFGAVNGLLGALGLGQVAWFSHFASAFTANVVTNTWLGFPFMMIVALGALESIPRDLYEAAAVDGASAWARFVHITLPNLRPTLMPAVVLGSIWTFNMFNVIYLVSGGKPAGATDILVTQAYRWAFERGQRFGMAAAYATIIFVILVAWTLLAQRISRKAVV
jgi:ABC-type sugar transport system permease subunit